MTMSGIKVYLHYEESTNGAPSKTSKIAVPGSWLGRPVSDVIGLFAKAYNDKNPDHKINTEEVHLVTADGTKIFSDETVSLTLGDHSDYHIKHGKYVQRVAATEAVDGNNVDAKVGAKTMRCKNYGCNKMFTEEENNDEACHHHTGPPIFHDTMKCWSCCKDRKAYDFESFQLITGCSVGRHSVNSPGAVLGASPNAPTTVFSAPSSSATPTPLTSISDYNKANPSAATAASSAAKTLANRKSSRSADGLTAKCQRKGCQIEFHVADNSATACVYHKGQPIFHDAYKYWSCCSEKKCYEFDEFLAVPGCTIGFHDDGVIDL